MAKHKFNGVRCAVIHGGGAGQCYECVYCGYVLEAKKDEDCPFNPEASYESCDGHVFKVTLWANPEFIENAIQKEKCIKCHFTETVPAQIPYGTVYPRPDKT